MCNNEGYIDGPISNNDGNKRVKTGNNDAIDPKRRRARK